MLIPGLNCDPTWSYFLNCIPGYHCVLIIIDITPISERTPQRCIDLVRRSICWQGSCNAFPLPKSLALAAKTPILFLWHLCIKNLAIIPCETIIESMLLCWLSFSLHSTLDTIALCVCTVVLFCYMEWELVFTVDMWNTSVILSAYYCHVGF